MMSHWKALVALLPALALACGGSSNATQPSASGGQLAALDHHVNITFWHAMHGAAQKPTIEQIASDFNKSQSNVTVTLVDQVDYPTLRTKTLAALAAGNPPDAAQCYENWAAEYANRKAIVDMTPYVNARDGLSQSDLKDIWPSMLNDGKLKGVQYMMPFNKSDSVLYYNDEMFKEAGISAPPKTWSEFSADARKIAAAKGASAQTTSADGNRWGTDFSDSNGYENLWEGMVYEYGGTLLNKDQTKSAFNSSAGQQAIQVYADLVKSGAAHRVQGFEDEDDLGSRHIGMMVNTIAGYSFVTKSVGGRFTLKTAPIPAGPKSQAVEMFGTNSCIFSRAARDVQQGAFQWIKYFTNRQATQLWSQKTGYMPVRQSAFNDMKSNFYNTSPDGPNLEVAVSQLPHAVFAPAVSVWDEAAYKVIQVELVNVVDGKKTARQGLDDAAKKVDDLLANG